MDMTLRWFGEGVDSVSLEQIRQIPGCERRDYHPVMTFRPERSGPWSAFLR